MDQLRYYRYSIPGIFAGLTIAIGMVGEQEVAQIGKNFVPAIGLLAGVLLSFAIGYPFAVIADFASRWLRPDVPPELENICEAHDIQDHKERGILISTLHHTYWTTTQCSFSPDV